MIELGFGTGLAIGLAISLAGLVGFIMGVLYNQSIKKYHEDSYASYLKELSENSKFDPHTNGKRHIS